MKELETYLTPILTFIARAPLIWFSILLMKAKCRSMNFKTIKLREK